MILDYAIDVGAVIITQDNFKDLYEVIYNIYWQKNMENSFQIKILGSMRGVARGVVAIHTKSNCRVILKDTYYSNVSIFYYWNNILHA